MNSDRTMVVVRRVYDEVHLALWATLTAFVVYFAVFVAPYLPRIHARAERLQAQQAAAEQVSTCGKLGIGPNSVMYDRCMSNLQRYRAHIEQQFGDASDFF
ncbi:MAG: hypothetical protein ACRECV_09610 [Xanthobacteraceae bacterium]